MRKMEKWILILLILAAFCFLGVWYVSSQSREPVNATLVRNTLEHRNGEMGERKQWAHQTRCI